MIEDFPQLIKKAAAGDDSAIDTIIIYFKEQAVSVEEQEEIHIYLKHAEHQSHHAIYFRALLYDYGYGVKQDSDMAFILLREAAAKGNSKAAYEVGRHFLEGIGIEKNDDNAIQWLKLAAGSPHYVREAMYDLGRMYEQGLGAQADPAKAKEWYEKAAKKGHAGAREKLG